MKPAIKTARIKTKESDSSEKIFKSKRKESKTNGIPIESSENEIKLADKSSATELIYPPAPEKLEINF